MLLSAGGLILLVLALNQGEELGGWTSAPVLGLFAGAAVALTGFVWWELRARAPLADLRLLRDPLLRSGLMAALAATCCWRGATSCCPST